MSEYQYYEFQAIDRPLTREEMSELRSCSSRARITSTRFTNVYHFGDFKGNTEEWMRRYFDAHLYDSNFGTRVFCLRFPTGWIDEDTIAPYQVEGALELIRTRTHLILSFVLESEPGAYFQIEESDGILASLLPIRAALAAGDLRALYIGWLSAVQSGLVDPKTTEPPVPPGLANDNAALDSLIGFLNLREDLVRAAAKNSSKPATNRTTMEISKWLGGISGNEKDSWLSRFLAGDDPGLRRECLACFHQSFATAKPGKDSARSVEKLLSDANDLEAERVKKERREAERKERSRILALAGQETDLWQSVIKLSESSSSRYQENAVSTLKDLRELAFINGDGVEYQAKLEGFIELRRRKSAFMKRMQEAGLF
jgi:hypothetical protein